MGKRALILAGGGLKVAYQAGVLQVWLDEAKLAFDDADGASGGVFNLAMYCQGFTGKQIADNWRDFPVLSSIALNRWQCWRLFWAKSLFSYDKFRRVVMREKWHLDWTKICSGVRTGTFNAYDFTNHRLCTRTHSDMDEDFLLACVSLPGWFSPVELKKTLYIDGVYVTDANLIAAIQRGADELWIIWTVSESGIWQGGPVNTYFQIIEASANGNLARDLERIRENNRQIDNGKSGEFGRPIAIELLKAEVPLHYLFNFSSRKFTAAVDQGIEDARVWCRDRGLLGAEHLFDGGGRDAPIRVHNELEIDATPERIWSILVRAVDWPKWYPNSKNVRIQDGREDLFLGAYFSWITFGICLRSEVREFVPCERIGWTGKFIGVDVYHTWQIARTGNGCRVITEELQNGWLARVAHYLMPRQMHYYHALWLNRLALECARHGGDVPGMPRRKDLQDLQSLPRQAIFSYLQKQEQPSTPRPKLQRLKPIRYPLIWAFTPRRMWNFVVDYLQSRFGRCHRFNTYVNSGSKDNGIYQLEGQNGVIRIALAGDWATGTDEAHEVSERIKEFHPHYSIHLGDVYYVGSEAEVNENFLGRKNPGSAYDPCKWPCGSRGTFALNGNHEMYARGLAYYDRMLPTLGLVKAGSARGQGASFFCLENEYWRIIGLDTGYTSIGIPLVEYAWRPDSRLRPEQIEWLREKVRPSSDGRGIILLTHHQYFSRFDDWYAKAAMQLADFICYPVLWFWGHEHRMAIYKEFGVKNGLSAFGRNIGHGGMPVDLPPSKPAHPECPLEFVDDRVYLNDEDLKVGMNGFARLTLERNRMGAEYVDLRGKVIFRECWAVNDGLLTRLAADRFVTSGQHQSDVPVTKKYSGENGDNR